MGYEPFPGSLNIVLKKPVRLSERSAIVFDDARRLMWPGELHGVPVWLYRWRRAPLHAIEVISRERLRQRLALRDGDAVEIRVTPDHICNISRLSRITWAIVWLARRRWCYTNDRYYHRTARWCQRCGATQKEASRPSMKQLIKRTPVLGPVAIRVRRKVQGPPPSSGYTFARLPIVGHDDAGEAVLHQLQNVLNYTKTSGSRYAATKYPAGYHTLRLNGSELRGQRDPSRRLDVVPIDFTGKTVLDLGCNQGGMLFELRDRIEWAVGVDYDARMINAANRIRSVVGSDNLDFFVLNLETEPLDLITDLLPAPRVDVVFLLAVCMWLDNWREVIDFAQSLSESMLFESNGTDEQQQDQEAYLRIKYETVTQLAEDSPDDPGQKRRRLFYAQ